MILCFTIGGFSIVLYLIQAYSALWEPEPPGMLRDFRDSNSTNSTPNNLTRPFDINRSFERGGIARQNPITFLTSPFSLILLFSGIVLLLGGVSIWSLTREKELVSVKEKITSLLLLPEERKIIEELKKFNGDVTQSQLVKRTGLSKVKVHRIINKLAAKGIIKKYQYGVTNKIILEKDV
jgi:hypothetical protein